MAESSTFTFRPRKELEADFEAIKDWCETRRLPLSAVFNSFLPAIAYALDNNTHEADDAIYVRCDFGDIKICPRTEHQ